MMSKSKLLNERVDLFHGFCVHNESLKLPGHENRMAGHERRIHKAIGPIEIKVRGRGFGEHCQCPICKQYRVMRTAGSHKYR